MVDSEDVERQIGIKYEREIRAHAEIWAIAYRLFETNRDKFFLDLTRPSSRAVGALYAKALKTMVALHRLAVAGYGEDAMVLARCQTNLCIDLAYICAADTEERARCWLANGQLARKEMADRYGRETPEDRKGVDWQKIKGRADRWREVRIADRATKAGLENFYDITYRHGSTFEHSDSWSALPFLALDESEEGVALQTGPSEGLVGASLTAGAFAIAQVLSTAWRYYGFVGAAEAEAQVHDIVATRFERPEGGT